MMKRVITELPRCTFTNYVFRWVFRINELLAENTIFIGVDSTDNNREYLCVYKSPTEILTYNFDVNTYGFLKQEIEKIDDVLNQIDIDTDNGVNIEDITQQSIPQLTEDE
jgi:hypothetical protein